MVRKVSILLMAMAYLATPRTIGEGLPQRAVANPGASLTYMKYFGGARTDEGMAVALDALGNIYITGQTDSDDFPAVNAFQPMRDKRGTCLGGNLVLPCTDAFVMKLDQSGQIVYSTYLGGSFHEEGAAIAADESGNAYVTGYTLSENFPVLSGLQKINRGAQDMFISKFSPSGRLLYSTYLGGNGFESANGVAVDMNNRIYVTGFTDSPNFPLLHPLQNKNAGVADAFVVKINASGSALVYSTYLGGEFNDVGYAIAADSSGSAYIAGDTSSRNFPTRNPFQSTLPGVCCNPDGFVSKLSPSGGVLMYSTYLGGNGYDLATGIALHAGHAYVTGITTSKNFPTANAFQAVFAGYPFDAFIAKLNTQGSGLVFSTYLGGSGLDESDAIVVNSFGQAYVTGVTRSPDFPTRNPFQSYHRFYDEAFITKFTSTGSNLVFSSFLGGKAEDQAWGLAKDRIGNVYVTGLSNSNKPVGFHVPTDMFLARIR